MNKIFGAILILLIATGCGDATDTSFDFEKEGGTEIEISIDAKDFLLKESEYTRNPKFTQTLEKTSISNDMPGETFIENFVERFSSENPGAKLALIFNQANRNKYDNKLSEEELKNTLIKEFGYAKDRTEQVLKSRLSKFGLKKFNIIQLPTGFKIQIGDEVDEERIIKLLQSNGNLGFYETYNNTEMFQKLIDLNNLLPKMLYPDATMLDDSTLSEEEYSRRNNPLFMILQPDGGPNARGQYEFYENARFGFAKSTDTSTINRYLNADTMGIFPPDLTFSWSAKEEEFSNAKNVFGLYLIKTRNINLPSLDGEMITEAREEANPSAANIQIAINFSAEGASRWEQITEKNKNRFIAIIMDGSVYSCPKVVEKISGGTAVITGNFTEEEAKDLIAVLNSGTLPCRLRITSVEEK